MDGCPFCASYEDLPFALGGIVYEDDLVSAHHSYQDEEPNYLGHLIEDKTPRSRPCGADEAEGQAIGLAVARLSKALRTCRVRRKSMHKHTTRWFLICTCSHRPLY